MTEKTIDTLIADIYNMFGQPTDDPDSFSIFGQNLTALMSNRFSTETRGGRLRLSNIGKPDRQLWFEINDPEGGEPLMPQAAIKFMYGDMQEQLCLLLAKLAGHKVECEQEEVEVNGVKGRIDCMIDGCVVDVKSASRFGFKKFKDGSLLAPGNDPFGYIGQLAAYVAAKTPGKDGYFFAVNKDLGHLALLKVPAEVLAAYNVVDRIDFVKEMVKGPIPERCYEDEPDGQSGNRKLGVGCSYCRRKFDCWPGLRTFFYSTGPRFLTKVVREPKVPQNPDFEDYEV